MFEDLIDFPIESERLRWEARQVVRDLDDEPHLLLRISITGTYFPQRALEPFVAVDKVRSRFVIIAADGLSANAYFDEQVPHNGRVEFGYGDEVLLRFPRAFHHGAVKTLDPKRLPKNTHFMDRFFGPVG